MNSKEKSDHDAAQVARFLDTDPAEIDQKINEPIKNLLSQYSHIPQDEIVAHVLELRDRAFTIYPYACIGQLRFLNLSLRTHPSYTEILSRLNSPPQDNATPTPNFLDLGCCFGQELRQLVLDGVTSQQLYGIDVEAKFLDLGYDLFCDRTILQCKFIATDILAENDEEDGVARDRALESVRGNVDVVWAGSFFHLFPRPRQIQAAKAVVDLLRPVPGSLLVGRQLGSVAPREYDIMKDGRWQFRHSPETWAEFWAEVGRETGTRWKVEASLDEVDFGYAQNKEWGDPEMRRLLFRVERE